MITEKIKLKNKRLKRQFHEKSSAAAYYDMRNVNKQGRCRINQAEKLDIVGELHNLIVKTPGINLAKKIKQLA